MSEINVSTKVTEKAAVTPKPPPTKEDIRKALEALAHLVRNARKKHRGQNPGAFGGRLKSSRPKMSKNK